MLFVVCCLLCVVCCLLLIVGCWLLVVVVVVVVVVASNVAVRGGNLKDKEAGGALAVGGRSPQGSRRGSFVVVEYCCFFHPWNRFWRGARKVQ